MTIPEIMREERAATLEKIQRLPYPQSVRDDVTALCVRILDAVNGLVAELDREIHEGAVPTALRLMAGEQERLLRRFQEAGFAAKRSS